MDPDTIDQVTAAIVGAGTVASLAIGFAKRFGGKRFVLATKLFKAFARLVNAVDSKLS